MKNLVLSIFKKAFHDERGQALPYIAFGFVGFLGAAGLAIDIGHAYVVKDQLQLAVNAAALAGTAALPNDPTSTAIAYGAKTGESNSTNFTANTPTVSALCLTTVKTAGVPCYGAANANAVRVTQTAAVSTYFLGVFGVKTLNISAQATAANATSPANVAVVVDSTLSMTTVDSNCGGVTQMACALNGVQQLLESLSPTVDPVALFTFPNITVATSGLSPTGSPAYSFGCTSTFPSTYVNGKVTSKYDYSSTFGYYSMYPQPAYSGVPTDIAYSFPSTSATSYSPSLASSTASTTPTYEVIPFSTDYQSTSTSNGLNPLSELAQASGGVSGCGGLAPGNYDGDIGTYYAGAMYAAQAALLTEQEEQTANSVLGSRNVIVLLSDGDATAPGASSTPDSAYPAMGSGVGSGTTYPSSVDECHQGITAAEYAGTYSGNNTTIFVVAYGASTGTTGSSSNCHTDNPRISPCDALQNMAYSNGKVDSGNFYSDPNAPGGDSGCVGSSTGGGDSSLKSIFQAIGKKLSPAHLIPNSTT